MINLDISTPCKTYIAKEFLYKCLTTPRFDPNVAMMEPGFNVKLAYPKIAAEIGGCRCCGKLKDVFIWRLVDYHTCIDDIYYHCKECEVAYRKQQNRDDDNNHNDYEETDTDYYDDVFDDGESLEGEAEDTS